jgi:hypothetical protein
MKISISGICERDMDLFLIEELVADRDLLVWLFHRCNVTGELDFEELSITHSAVVGNGESDVEIRAKLKNGQIIVILIENKVDASFQPRQAERYRERAETFCRNGLVDTAITLLFAPSCYIGENTQTHGFDVTLTYEELRDWISNRQERDERVRYKEMLLQAAIEKSGRGYSPLVDGAVSSFQHRYWELACALEPDIMMNEPKGRPSGSTFIQFRTTGLPKGLVVVHKVDRGYVDLQFAGWGKRVPALKKLTDSIRDEAMTVEPASGSAVIRLHVPPLNVARAAEDQINEIKEGIAAAGHLHRWVWKNQATLETILRTSTII